MSLTSFKSGKYNIHYFSLWGTLSFVLFYCYADRKGQVQAESSVCPRKPGQLTVSWRDRSHPCHLLQPWSPPELRTEGIWGQWVSIGNTATVTRRKPGIFAFILEFLWTSQRAKARVWDSSSQGEGGRRGRRRDNEQTGWRMDTRRLFFNEVILFTA